jgi:predicted transcriptional regulator
MADPKRPTPLGELERAVMTHLWDEGRADAKTVFAAIGKPRRITLNTVQSTVERLYRKGLLTREKVSHAYVYAPRVSREEYGAEVMHGVVRDLLGGKLEPVLAAFVDLTARVGKSELSRLELLVSERKEREAKN